MRITERAAGLPDALAVVARCVTNALGEPPLIGASWQLCQRR